MGKTGKKARKMAAPAPIRGAGIPDDVFEEMARLTLAEMGGASAGAQGSSAEQAERKAMVEMLIKAISEAESTQTSSAPAPAALFRAAYDKMQFDFPILSEGEAQALADEYTGSLSGSKRFAMPITDTLVTGVCEGAQRAPEGAVPAPDKGNELRSAPPTAVVGLQLQYQRLCGCLLVKGVRHLLSLPLTELESALVSYSPDDLAVPAAPAPPIPEGEEVPPPLPPLISEDADESDDDDVAYEPLEPPPAPRGPADGPGAHAGGGGAGVGAKVGRLCMLASYQVMSAPAVWEAMGLVDDAVEVLRLLRARGDELQGLHAPSACAAVVALLSDRLVDAPAGPAGVKSLPRILGALGLEVLDGQQSRVAEEVGRGSSTSLAVSLLASLAVRMSSQSVLSRPGSKEPKAAGAARLLWPCLPLPLITMRLQELEAKALDVGPDWVTELTLLSSVLEFYVVEAPGGGGAHTALLKGGTWRELVNLFGRCGGHPGMEPLRRTVLWACCGSAELRDWALRVPTFKAALAGPAFAPGGPAEVHGAMWCLVIPPTVPVPGKGPTAAPGAGGGVQADGGERLRGLLSMEGGLGGAPRLARVMQALLLLRVAALVVRRSSETSKPQTPNPELKLQGRCMSCAWHDPLESPGGRSEAVVLAAELALTQAGGTAGVLQAGRRRLWARHTAVSEALSALQKALRESVGPVGATATKGSAARTSEEAGAAAEAGGGWGGAEGAEVAGGAAGETLGGSEEEGEEMVVERGGGGEEEGEDKGAKPDGRLDPEEEKGRELRPQVARLLKELIAIDTAGTPAASKAD